MPAAFILSDFIFDELGNPVTGIQAQAYLKLLDGTRVLYGSPASTNSAGKWAITIDTPSITNPGWSGYVSVEISNPASLGQKRRREGDAQIQVGAFVGASGDAPIPVNSITGAHIQDNALSGTTGDNKLGTRTLNQAIATTYANSALMSTILSWFAKRLKEILGTTNWSDTIPITLTALKIHAARHAVGGLDPLTPAQIGAVKNNGGAANLSLTTATPTGGATNDIAVTSGTAAGVWVKVAGVWTKVADLSSGGGAGTSFGPFQITNGGFGGTLTTVAPAADGQVFGIIAGSGISMAPDATSKKVTISATAAGGATVGLYEAHNTSAVVCNGGDQDSVIANSPTVAYSGLYLFTATASINQVSGADTNALLKVYKNPGATILTQFARATSKTGDTNMALTGTVNLNANDSLQLVIDNNGASTFTVIGSAGIITLMHVG
jgi:hypothetical protein